MSTTAAVKSCDDRDMSSTSRQQRRSSDERVDESGIPSEESLRRPRKSLPFLPRTSQYERHPLLQTRSTASGLSEFELLMLEKDALVRRKSVNESSRHNQKLPIDTECPSAGESSSVGRDTRQPIRPPLVPRGAQCESHPLFVRSESGVCELETYLSEIAMSANMTSSTAVKDVGSGNGNSFSSSVVQSQRASTVLKKLEPRTTQWERNSLLEIKDETGMTELEWLLMEKDKELSSVSQNDEKSSSVADGSVASSSCTVCGDDRSSARCRCTSADGRSSQATSNATFDVRSFSVDACPGDTSATTTSDDVCPVASSTQQKRVRFVAQRQKTEPEEVGQYSPAAGAASAALGTDGNNGSDVKVSHNNKPSKCPSRNRTCRADSVPSDGQRKSCCIS